MFGNINKEYNAKKRAKRENQFITESVLGVEEIQHRSSYRLPQGRNRHQ